MNTSPDMPSSRPMTLRQQLHKDVHKVFEAFVEAFVNPKHVQIMKVMELVDDYSQEIAREAKLDMVKTFMTYENNQPGYIDWDFLANQLSGLELTQKPENNNKGDTMNTSSTHGIPEDAMHQTALVINNLLKQRGLILANDDVLNLTIAIDNIYNGFDSNGQAQ